MSISKISRRFVVYNAVKRRVRTTSGEFIAVHHTMTCKFHRKIFRSDALDSIVSIYCTF